MLSSKNSSKTRRLAMSSMIAAIYVILTLLIAPFSFGVLQFRISEALTILPLCTPCAIPGLSIGCFISNLFGAAMGQATIWDSLFGTAATLIASLCTFLIGKSSKRLYRYLFGPLPAVICNGIIIGFEISMFFGGCLFINILLISLEELIVCYFPGLILLTILDKKFPNLNSPFSCQ